MKILLATDGSDYSRAAIDFCRSIIAEPARTTIKIISAVDYLAPIPTDPMGASAEYYLHLETAARDQAKDYVGKAEKQIRALFPDTKLDVKTDVIDGSPPQVIVETADEWGADLIVIGSHGHGFWERMLLGSVSNSVLHHAHCSVLAVRKTDKANDAG